MSLFVVTGVPLLSVTVLMMDFSFSNGLEQELSVLLPVMLVSIK